MKYLEEIENFNPINEQEEKDKEVVLKYINDFPNNILTRENEYAHISSSGFILNKNRDKVLMIYHNIYQSWGWTGGHADGDEDLLYVALKEAKEETGVDTKPIVNNVFVLDILPVNGHFKRGKWVSSHEHLNVTYILEADESQELIMKEDENSGVKWVPIDEVVKESREECMQVVYQKIINKMKESNII